MESQVQGLNLDKKRNTQKWSFKAQEEMNVWRLEKLKTAPRLGGNTDRVPHKLCASIHPHVQACWAGLSLHVNNGLMNSAVTVRVPDTSTAYTGPYVSLGSFIHSGPTLQLNCLHFNALLHTPCTDTASISRAPNSSDRKFINPSDTSGNY